MAEYRKNNVNIIDLSEMVAATAITLKSNFNSSMFLIKGLNFNNQSGLKFASYPNAYNYASNSLASLFKGSGIIYTASEAGCRPMLTQRIVLDGAGNYFIYRKNRGLCVSPTHGSQAGLVINKDVKVMFAALQAGGGSGGTSTGSYKAAGGGGGGAVFCCFPIGDADEEFRTVIQVGGKSNPNSNYGGNGNLGLSTKIYNYSINNSSVIRWRIEALGGQGGGGGNQYGGGKGGSYSFSNAGRIYGVSVFMSANGAGGGSVGSWGGNTSRNLTPFLNPENQSYTFAAKNGGHKRQTGGGGAGYFGDGGEGAGAMSSAPAAPFGGGGGGGGDNVWGSSRQGGSGGAGQIILFY